MSRAGGEVQRLVFGASVSMCVCYVGAPTKSLTFFILIKQISLLSWRLKICHHIICALEPSLVPTPDVKSSRPRRGWHRPPLSGLVRLFPIHMDWMGLEKIKKTFDLSGIQTHPIPLNPHGLRANRTSPHVARHRSLLIHAPLSHVKVA
jgi:hypothetical protein